MASELTDREKASMSIDAGRSSLMEMLDTLTIDYPALVDFDRLAMLVASYVSAVSYQQSELYDKEPEKRLEYVVKGLDSLELALAIDDKGCLKVDIHPIPNPFDFLVLRNFICGPEDESDITYEHLDGNNYYYIRNLNFYLTVDVVKQLNVNPQQVINMIKEEIKDEIGRVRKSMDASSKQTLSKP